MELQYSVSVQDSNYPEKILRLPYPPKKLWLRGSWDAKRPGVAMIGARAASRTNQDRARKISVELAKLGVGIISGGALGIDTAAHEGALSVQGATCSVLGTSIDDCYPKRNRELFQNIVKQGGCLISRFEPGTNIRKGNFPLRNQMIAALSDAVILIQSKIHSGSRYTADMADKLGVPVLMIRGTFEAKDVMKTAIVVDGLKEILSVLGISSKIKKESLFEERSSTFEFVDEQSKKVYAALLVDIGKSLGVYELSQATHLPISTCMSALFSLEMEGLCIRLPGERYLATKIGNS